MAYFHCLIGGGSSGGGYTLTVTCDSQFAGTTITCTDGVTTLTETCPSSSPYEVVFEIPNGGTWTVSGIASGSTFTASIDIPDELELHSVPEGSTVLPTDDIQTWLACAGITDKSYTTLNEVLADSTTLLALISNDNASDYLVRSTTWASGITADSTAMTDIGANDYCARTLLADSTWRTAICNSAYIESVLDIKVPTMTSDTTPSGQVVKSGQYQTSEASWKAFDGNSSTKWSSGTSGSVKYLGYIFTSSVCVNCIHFELDSADRIPNFTIQAYDGNTWDDITTAIVNTQASRTYDFANNTNYLGYRISVTTNGAVVISTLQFYGRQLSS